MSLQTPAVPRNALYWLLGAFGWVLLVMLPLYGAAQSAGTAADTAVANLQDAQKLLPRYKPAPPVPTVKVDVVDAVNQAAVQSGIDSKSLTRLQDVDGAARIDFSVVPGDAIVKFVYQLQSQGLVVEQWQMNTNSPGIWTGSGLVRNP